MNHFYLDPKVKRNMRINIYEIELVKETKLITKWILILNLIDSIWDFSQSNLRYRNERK